MLGDVAAATNDAAAASTVYQTSLDTYRAIGDLWGVGEALIRLAQDTAVSDLESTSYLAQALQVALRTRTVAQLQRILGHLIAAGVIALDGKTAVSDLDRFDKIEPITQRALARISISLA